MSASPMARHVESKAIPIRRVALHDPSELPHDYSTTPGGTLYSTTPGGTKIVYERAFLMNLRSSPIARTPPKFDIPESLQKGTPNKSPNRQPKTPQKQTQKKTHFKNNNVQDEEQFQMDM
ncbi:eukaryotic translation initiation factor 4e-binding protein [Holotrichia oblita]|uniref:Eukaryotic translation initiation factor 4e-binding protein n=1 Tax=Holotrichia oblita TaxID=644536 RepID=A0ACB9SNU1_HOLOL|nr:eukaryotic translation initiation factor 4e-binding protein [Holotrichia oblita]